MPTKRELVEAHSFARRRLVTALVSGAPAGREVEPGRPGRTVVGGLALAVLVAAGAAIAGVLDRGAPEDWTSSELVVSEETGQAYVILPEEGSPARADAEPVVLRPVVNLTSAALILGAGVEPVMVPQDAIDEQVVGRDVGIPGAPASLPATDRLVGTGWTACTADDRGIRVRVAAEPDVRLATDAGRVVTAGGASYVIAAGRAFRLPDGDGVDNMLGAMGLPARVLAPEVPRAWVRLFPVGAALDGRSLGLTGVGDRPVAWDAAGVPGRARVGDVLVDAAGDAVVMTTAGPADLDAFALAVYTHTALPDLPAPRVISVPRLPDLTRAALPISDTHWPTELPEPVVGDPCAVLVSAPDSPAVVQLAVQPGQGDGVVDSVGNGDRVEVEVDPGYGAYVLAGGAGGDRDPRPVIIDSTGRAHPLDGDGTPSQLGYADHPAPVVPDAWVRLFGEGVPLSKELALCGPVSVGSPGGDACD